jgi:hypothetical protein
MASNTVGTRKFTLPFFCDEESALLIKEKSLYDSHRAPINTGSCTTHMSSQRTRGGVLNLHTTLPFVARFAFAKACATPLHSLLTLLGINSGSRAHHTHCFDLHHCAHDARCPSCFKHYTTSQQGSGNQSNSVFNHRNWINKPRKLIDNSA